MPVTIPLLVTVGDAVANVSYTIAPKELTNPTIEVEAEQQIQLRQGTDAEGYC